MDGTAQHNVRPLAAHHGGVHGWVDGLMMLSTALAAVHAAYWLRVPEMVMAIAAGHADMTYAQWRRR